MKLNLLGYFFRIRRFYNAFFVTICFVVSFCSNECIFSCFFRSWRNILCPSTGF